MLKSFNRMKISQKLPLIMVLLTAINVLANAGLQGDLMYYASVETSEKSLASYQEQLAVEMTEYLDSIKSDLVINADSAHVRQAIRDFDAGYKALGAEPTEQLQKIYIDENPNPLGEKDKMDSAPDGSLYSMVHTKYHPWFHKIQQAREYYDIFLMNKEGDIVYTVFKERDFATSTTHGQWKDTDIGKAFTDAKANPVKDSVTYYDFAAYAPSNNVPASFIAAPVLDEQGEFMGAMVFLMPAGKINNIFKNTDAAGKTSAIYLVGQDHLMRTDLRFEKEPTTLKEKIDEESVDKALAGEKGAGLFKDQHTGEMAITAYQPFEFEGVKWALIGEVSRSEALQGFYKTLKLSAISSLVILALIALISVWYSRRLTNPIKDMVGAMKELADGNNVVSVPSLERADEIGDMAKAVQVFKENALEMERMEVESGKAKVRAEEEKKAAMNKLADDFDSRTSSVIMSLTSAASQMQQTAEKMNDASERTSEISSAVAAAATEADANVQTVAAATEELTASAQEIAQQINMVATMAGNASMEAETTSSEVKNLQEMAISIGEVVGAIKEIAEQTNLLALNATIEAARAGEAGKGFAVVADEVKKLANETAQKTEEIDARVSAIQNAINSSVQAMDKIIRNVKSIDEATTSVTAAVEEQNAATGEIGRNVAEASTGTQQVSENIVTVQETAHQTGEASKTVLEAAGELSKLSVELRSQVGSFLTEIRGGQDGKSANDRIKLAQAAE